MRAATEQHVDALTAMLYPAYTRRCEHCGGYVVSSPEEVLRSWTEAAYKPLVELTKALQQPTTGLATMAPQMPGASAVDWLTPWSKQKGHRKRAGCGCRECECRDCQKDDCHCSCCVVDADLVVHARLGERRVVPVVIENTRRREREIKVELSEFSSRRGAGSGVRGRIVGPSEFTLGACDQREVIVLIEVGFEREKGGEGGEAREEGAAPEGEEGGEGEAAVDYEARLLRVEHDEGRIPDVDECVVAYADLRVVGCENRPIRIAVSTLPRDCHAYPVDCAQTCC